MAKPSRMRRLAHVRVRVGVARVGVVRVGVRASDRVGARARVRVRMN